MPPPPATSVSPPRPQLPAPGVALSLFAESFAHRAELAVLEVEEARDHAFFSTLFAAVAGALGLLAGFAFSLLIAGLVWDGPHRAGWLAGLCVVYLVGAVATAIIVARRLRTWRPLCETQLQLQQDYQCLSNLLKSAIQ